MTLSVRTINAKQMEIICFHENWLYFIRKIAFKQTFQMKKNKIKCKKCFLWAIYLIIDSAVSNYLPSNIKK